MQLTTNTPFSKLQRVRPSHQASQASYKSVCWQQACPNWCEGQNWWICNVSMGSLWSGKRSKNLKKAKTFWTHKSFCLLRCLAGWFEIHQRPRLCLPRLWPSWEMCFQPACWRCKRSVWSSRRQSRSDWTVPGCARLSNSKHLSILLRLVDWRYTLGEWCPLHSPCAGNCRVAWGIQFAGVHHRSRRHKFRYHEVCLNRCKRVLSLGHWAC